MLWHKFEVFSEAIVEALMASLGKATKKLNQIEQESFLDSLLNGIREPREKINHQA